MLRSIYIDNYALINKLEISFEKGLTIITGETGAGKSILLGALSLLLGKRADTSVLNDPDRKCIVEGSIDVTGYDLVNFFEENELDYATETILRREISSNGKSRAFINDSPVTLNVLQDLSLQLIDIHSQHQNLSLNNEEYIRWIIDTYAGTAELLKKYQSKFHTFRKQQTEYEKARAAYLQDKENIDFLSHQFEELQAANLKNGELDDIEQEHDTLAHAEEIKIGLGASIDLLDDETRGILPQLKQVLDQMGKVTPHLSIADDLRKRIDTAYIDLKDISGEISIQADKLEYDPGRLEFLSQRIDQLYSLTRKYKIDSVEELISIRDELDDKLQQLSIGDFELEKLADKLSEEKSAMLKAAEELSLKRKESFESFTNKVNDLTARLGMKDTVFSIAHSETEPNTLGIDKISFLFSAGAGIAAKDISKVASGGELSRLMLSIKSLISDSSGLPSIIFDEIDTGVSGDIADKVGTLIGEMAKSMQVINITHLPQVASKGDHHFKVSKQSKNGSITTTISELSEEERIREIAKMLSGDTITEAAIENAKVLLSTTKS